MRRTLSAIALLFVCALPALAQRDTRPANQLLITSAWVDYGIGKLYVAGSNFGAGTPTVKLNGTALQVLSPTPTSIVAMIPPGTLPGSYLLTVASGPSAIEFDAFSVTIGSAGPKGDKGDRGDQGLNGPKGETGPAGATGPKGDAGLPGPKGDTGPAGAPGAIGPQGATGAAGPQGAKGDIGAAGPPSIPDPTYPFATTIRLDMPNGGEASRLLDVATLVVPGLPSTTFVLDSIDTSMTVPEGYGASATVLTTLNGVSSRYDIPFEQPLITSTVSNFTRIYTERIVVLSCQEFAKTPSNSPPSVPPGCQFSIRGHAIYEAPTPGTTPDGMNNNAATARPIQPLCGHEYVQNARGTTAPAGSEDWFLLTINPCEDGTHSTRLNLVADRGISFDVLPLTAGWPAHGATSADLDSAGQFLLRIYGVPGATGLWQLTVDQAAAKYQNDPFASTPVSPRQLEARCDVDVVMQGTVLATQAPTDDWIRIIPTCLDREVESLDLSLTTDAAIVFDVFDSRNSARIGSPGNTSTRIAMKDYPFTYLHVYGPNGVAGAWKITAHANASTIPFDGLTTTPISPLLVSLPCGTTIGQRGTTAPSGTDDWIRIALPQCAGTPAAELVLTADNGIKFDVFDMGTNGVLLNFGLPTGLSRVQVSGHQNLIVRIYGDNGVSGVWELTSSNRSN